MAITIQGSGAHNQDYSHIYAYDSAFTGDARVGLQVDDDKCHFTTVSVPSYTKSYKSSQNTNLSR